MWYDGIIKQYKVCVSVVPFLNGFMIKKKDTMEVKVFGLGMGLGSLFFITPNNLKCFWQNRASPNKAEIFFVG